MNKSQTLKHASKLDFFNPLMRNLVTVNFGHILIDYQ